MPRVFQLILPFQLDLPFEAAGGGSARPGSGGGPARTARAKRPRRESQRSLSLALPSLVMDGFLGHEHDDLRVAESDV